MSATGQYFRAATLETAPPKFVVEAKSSTSLPQPVSGFIPALDGLRGLAVMGVLLFHLRLRGSSLGWAGVELFFVLSGFLITRILLNTRDKPGYFKKFYLRRAFRIFPIYYLVLLVYSIVALASHGSGLGTLSFYYFYLQTVPQLRTQFTAAPMLGHTWTLAIEEQFYLIWPMAVFLLRGRRLLAATIGMIIVALGLRVASLAFSNPFLVDGWLGVQIDALAAGAMVAYALIAFERRRVQRFLTTAFLAGGASLLLLVGLAGSGAFWTPRIWGRMWWGPLLITLLTSTFAGAVGLVATGHRWFRWLEFRPLMRCGKISYAIYLYHPFTFLLVEIILRRVASPHGRVGFVVAALVKLATTYAAAWTSWKLLENPVNRMKERFAA